MNNGSYTHTTQCPSVHHSGEQCERGEEGRRGGTASISIRRTVVTKPIFCSGKMGLKSSTLLQEEDIEEIQNETGCKFILIER